MKRRFTIRVVCLVAAALLASAGAALGVGRFTTVDQTIQDRDGDNRLEPGPGDDFQQRTELGDPREPDYTLSHDQSLVFFGQLTDFQLVDEESPARVEFLDKFGPPFTSAYRPQEGITPQTEDEMVAEMRSAISEVTRNDLDFSILTGDNADNTQCNETRWFIDILDGAANGAASAPVPGGGVAQNCIPANLRPSSAKVDPNSGIEGTCEPPDGRLYDGVRNENEYYEPDSSDGAEAGNDNEDGPGYSPNQAENEREAFRSSEVRDFPDLFEEMNKPFLPYGFDTKVPWYTAFGNHDSLVQGNQPRNAFFDQVIAQGCTKIIDLRPSTVDFIQGAAEDGFTPAELQQAFARIQQDIGAIAQNPGDFPGLTVTVPSDPRRHLLKKHEWIEQHFITSGVPVGHGFTAENLATQQGNYVFEPKPNLRFIALDTVAENGGDRGNIDDLQFQWLHEQLLAADESDQYAVVFGHHSIETMDQLPVSPFLLGDQGGYNGVIVHYGDRSQAEQSPRPCLEQDRFANPGPNETLKCLLLRHPSAIAFVNGHEHNNRVRPFGRPQGQPQSPAGGFWQINTAAHVDWPQQARVIDVVDTQDGNLSIFGVILDHGAPPNPGGAPAPRDGRGETGKTSRRLASIGRELSFNDPDSENGEDLRPDARGGEGDRNVELRLRDPYGP